MKKKLLFILLVSLLALPACIKESTPALNLEISKISQVDRSLLLITVSYNKEITTVQSIGFCYANHDRPGMNDSSVFIDKFYGNYSGYLGGVIIDSVYYFCAYARMEDGSIKYGPVVPFSIKKPVAPVTPCTLNEEEVVYRDDTYPTPTAYKAQISSTIGSYIIELHSYGGPPLKLYFDGPPTSGVYTTSFYEYFTEMLPKPGHKWMYTYIVSGNNTIEYGKPVYITKNADGTYKVDFCDLQLITYNNSRYTVKGSFRTQ